MFLVDVKAKYVLLEIIAWGLNFRDWEMVFLNHSVNHETWSSFRGGHGGFALPPSQGLKKMCKYLV